MSYSKESKWLLDLKYKGHENSDFYADVEKLKEGVPIDYLIGFSEFLGCKIHLDNCPLIPRTETEYWVSEFIKEHLEKLNSLQLSILDLFAGSGCIGVALLKHSRNVKVTFGEQESSLLKTIMKNVAENGIPQERFDIKETDMFSNISSKFNFILANPPYIDRARNETDESVILHEPHSALFAPENGLFFIKKIILEAHKHLFPGGEVYIEFDSWQKDEISSYLNSIELKYQKHQFIIDQFGHPRVLRLTLAK